MKYSYVPVPHRFLCLSVWCDDCDPTRLNMRGVAFLEENSIEVTYGYSSNHHYQLFFVMEHEDAVMFKLKEIHEENLR